jgi:hypothetical protein
MWFLGARPLTLGADGVTVQRWLSPEDAEVARPSGASFSLLASVRTLVIGPWSPTAFTQTDGAQLLRAAPHLETLNVSAFRVNFEPSWLEHPAFDGLMHLKLRYVRLYGFKLRRPLSSDFVPCLRQRHFPRLKSVAIGGCHYYVTPLEPPAAKSFFQRFVNAVGEFVSKF